MPSIYTETCAEPFDIDEFLVRVAKREETDVETAPRHARAVFFTLAEAVSSKEWFDVIVELPEEYHGLFPPRLA